MDSNMDSNIDSNINNIMSSSIALMNVSTNTDITLMNETINKMKQTTCFIREPILIDGTLIHSYNKESNPEIPNDYIEVNWTTVSHTKLELKNLWFISKFQLTAKSVLIAENCRFVSHKIAITESAIEIFANSVGIFKNCEFQDFGRTAIIARNCSYVEFIDCVFHTKNVSVYISDMSNAKLVNCRFVDSLDIIHNGEHLEIPEGKTSIGLFLINESRCEVQDTVVEDVKAKGFFLKQDSSIKFTNCKCMWNKAGFITLAELSNCYIFNSEIYVAGNTCIRCVKKDKLYIKDSKIETKHGNCLNIENSVATIEDCFIDNKSDYISVAVLDRNANVVFNNCTILGKRCITCKTFGQAIFNRCTFEGERLGNAKDEAITTFNECIVKTEHKELRQINTGILKRADPYVEEHNEEEEERCRSWISPTYTIYNDKLDINDEEFDDCFNKDFKKITLDEIEKHLILDENDERQVVFRCLRCNKIIDDFDECIVAQPCCHLLCKDCKDMNVEYCNVCDTEIRSTVKCYKEYLCRLCLINKANVTCNCGHIALCVYCYAKYVDCNTFIECPMCRNRVNTVNFNTEFV